MNTLHQPGVREISKFPKRMQFLILIWLYRSAITGLTDLGISWLVKLDLIAHCFERAAFRCSRLICHNSVIPAIHPDHCSPEILGVDVERRLFCAVIVKLVTSVRVPVVYPSQRITPCMTFVIQSLIHVLLIYNGCAGESPGCYMDIGTCNQLSTLGGGMCSACYHMALVSFLNLVLKRQTETVNGTNISFKSFKSTKIK